MNLQEIIDQVDSVWVPNSLTVTQKIAMLNAIHREVFRKVQFPNLIERIYTVAGVSLYALPTNCKPDRIQRVVVTDSAGNEQEYEAKSLSDRLTDYSFTTVNDNLLWLYPTPSISGGTVAGITVTNGGSGYTSPPTVTISGGGGTGASAEAEVVNGIVTRIIVVLPGSGYTKPPVVTISGGGGSGATAEATIYTDSIYLYYAPSPIEFTDTYLSAEPQIPRDYHQYFVWRLAEYVAKARQDVLLANNFKADADELLVQMIREFDHDSVSSFQQGVKW